MLDYETCLWSHECHACRTMSINSASVHDAEVHSPPSAQRMEGVVAVGHAALDCRPVRELAVAARHLQEHRSMMPKGHVLALRYHSPLN